MNFLSRRDEKFQMQTDGNNNQFAFFISGDIS